MTEFFAYLLAVLEIVAWPAAFLISVFVAKDLVEAWGRTRKGGVDHEVWSLLRVVEDDADRVLGSGELDERARVWSDELSAMSVGSGLVGVQAGWIGVVTASFDVFVERFTTGEKPYNMPSMLLTEELRSAGVDAEVLNLLNRMRRVRLLVVSEKHAQLPEEIGRRYGVVAARMRARLEAFSAENDGDVLGE